MSNLSFPSKFTTFQWFFGAVLPIIVVANPSNPMLSSGPHRVGQVYFFPISRNNMQVWPILANSFLQQRQQQGQNYQFMLPPPTTATITTISTRATTTPPPKIPFYYQPKSRQTMPSNPRYSNRYSKRPIDSIVYPELSQWEYENLARNYRKRLSLQSLTNSPAIQTTQWRSASSVSQNALPYQNQQQQLLQQQHQQQQQQQKYSNSFKNNQWRAPHSPSKMAKTTIYSRSSEFLWAIFVLFNFRLQDNANNFNNNNNNIHNKMVNYRTISNSLLDDRVRRPTHHRPLLIKTLPNMYWSPPRQH